MLALSPTVASHYYNCCTDGSTSLWNCGYPRHNTVHWLKSSESMQKAFQASNFTLHEANALLLGVTQNTCVGYLDTEKETLVNKHDFGSTVVVNRIVTEKIPNCNFLLYELRKNSNITFILAFQEYDDSSQMSNLVYWSKTWIKRDYFKTKFLYILSQLYSDYRWGLH
jgi:hypothetical protein